MALTMRHLTKTAMAEGQGEVGAAEEPPLAPPWQGGEPAADRIIVMTGIFVQARQAMPSGMCNTRLRNRTIHGFTNRKRYGHSGECHADGGSVPSRISATAAAI